MKIKIKELLQKFSEAKVVSNDSVCKLLVKEGIEAQGQSPDSRIRMVDAEHERILAGEAPQNTLFHLFNKLTFPGDSLKFSESREFLALPIQAPWGSMVASLETAKSLLPKKVLPIHDWHCRDEARHSFYKQARQYLLQFGIEFIPLETGKTVEL